MEPDSDGIQSLLLPLRRVGINAGIYVQLKVPSSLGGSYYKGKHNNNIKLLT